MDGCGLCQLPGQAWLRRPRLRLLINVPINAEVLAWSPQAPPADWAEVRDRWNQAHAFRTALALVALSCQIVAVLLPLPPRADHDLA